MSRKLTFAITRGKKLVGVVAVVGEDFWSAKFGREALEVIWNEGPLADLDSEGHANKLSNGCQKSWNCPRTIIWRLMTRM